MAIDGRDRLLRKLASLVPKTRQAIGKAVRQGADEIVAAQKRLVRKRTGALAASIVATSGANAPKYSQGGRGSQAGDPELTVVITAGNAKVRYAHLVEFSTAPHENKGLYEGSDHPGTTAQPFFYGPYRAYRKRVKARITRATKKAAREAAS